MLFIPALSLANGVAPPIQGQTEPVPIGRMLNVRFWRKADIRRPLANDRF